MSACVILSLSKGVEGGLLILDFANCLIASQFSSNNASFFFLDQPFIYFSKAIA
jgi:hypothetical protein